MAPNRLESENNEDENTSYKLHYNYILKCIIDIKCDSFDSSYEITVPLLTLELIRFIRWFIRNIVLVYESSIFTITFINM